MNSFPLAVFGPRIGKLSETFISRHMEDLLPGGTTVIVRNMEPYLKHQDIGFPYLLLGGADLHWHWFYRSIIEFLRLDMLSPARREVKSFFKNHHTQVVLSEYLDLSLRWLDLAQKMGIRFYAHAHGYDVSYILRKPIMRYRYLRLERADGIITMSEYSRKKLMGIGLSGKNIHVIPYGVNVPDEPLVRPGGDVIRCLAVGRMVAKKAPLLTLEAFRLALTDNPTLRLDYIGHGDLFNEVSRFVKDHSLENIVTLHGAQANSYVQEFMKRADIFIQHSKTDPLSGDEEGLPVGILEAMSNSLPVVSTRHAGIPEAVIQNATGYLSDEGDIKGMAANIIKLAGNTELRGRFGQSAWERAKQYFSWEKEKSALLNLLDL